WTRGRPVHLSGMPRHILSAMAKYPISRLTASSFGPFRHINVDLSPSLNVIIGDNATGKSQLLKLLYTGTKAHHDSQELTKRALSTSVAAKLRGVFRPES